MSGESSHQEDADLVRAARRSGGAALDAFMARMGCVPSMLSALNRRFGRPLADADLADLAQDTVLRVWRKLDTFVGGSRLETWVWKFCFFELRNAIRRRRRQEQREQSLAAALPLAEPTRDSLANLERVELGLARLAEDDALILRLHHYEQLGFEAIGERLGRPTNTVKTRYHRSLAKLRRWLTPHAAEEEA